MAGFLAVRDADHERRARAVDAARAALGRRGLTDGGSVVAGETALVWGTAPGAPIDVAGGTVVLGHAMSAGRLGAAAWRATWSGDGWPGPTDGFHVNLALDDDGTCTVDADLFGLFPVLHASAADATIVASSPALLRCHERFRPTIDRDTLAELLLVDAVLGATTVLRDVRRVPAGHVLRLTNHVEERATYTMPMSGALARVAPLRQLADRFHDALLDACRRHAPDGRTVMLLSGGLDSRLLAGSLHAAGVPFEAVTYGTTADSEARYAGRVAGALGLAHRVVPDDVRRAPFRDVIAWDGLVSTPSLDHPGLGERVDGIVSGFLMDATAGASHVDWSYDATTGEAGFAPFFSHLNAHGVPVDDARALLGRDAVDAALERVRSSWDASGDVDAERAWRFDLAHRQRFWVGSRVPDQLRSGWPVLPHLDRAVLEVVGSMAPAAVASRHLEIEVCKSHHPVLARLPLERTTFEDTALIPRTGDMVRAAVARKVRAARAAARRPVAEPRYFTRLFDVEGTGWREARAEIEGARAAAHEIFDPATFDRLVPPTTDPWHGPRSYPGANRSKLLLGVMALLAGGVEP